MRTFKDDLMPREAPLLKELIGELRVLSYNMQDQPEPLEDKFRARIEKIIDGFSKQIPGLGEGLDRAAGAVGLIGTMRHLWKGDKSQAFSSACLALTHAPDNAALWYSLGEALMMYREDMLAKKVMTHAASLNPNFVKDHFERDEYAARLGSLQLPIIGKVPSASTEGHSELADAVFQLEIGLIDLLHGAKGRGEKALSAALQFFSKHPEISLSKDEIVRANFVKALREGLRELDSDTLELPVVHLVEAISLNPSHARPFQLLAHLLADNRSFPEAGVFLSHAQAVNPDDESVARDISALEAFLIRRADGRPKLESRKVLAELVRRDIEDLNKGS